MKSVTASGLYIACINLFGRFPISELHLVTLHSVWYEVKLECNPYRRPNPLDHIIQLLWIHPHHTANIAN